MNKAQKHTVLFWRFSRHILETVVYHLSQLMPRDRKLWAFGAWKNEFVDNPKHFFITTNQDVNTKARCVWISRDRGTVQYIKRLGFEAVSLYSLKGIWCALRAGVYIYNAGVGNVTFSLSKGAFLINLWHGIPLKLINNDSIRYFRKTSLPERKGMIGFLNEAFRPRKVLCDDYVVSPSHYVTGYSFASAFGLSQAQCLDLGTPRTDLLFWACTDFYTHIEKYEKALLALIGSLGEYSKLYMYAPTYRDTGNDLIADSGLDVHDLDKRLGEEKAILLMKLHPSLRLRQEELGGLKNVHHVDSSVDINPLLAYVDVLITDYSSIFFDFLLLNRPIVFFCFDLVSYRENNRSLYFDYEEVTPGVKARNHKELCNALFSDEGQQWEVERSRVKNQFWGEYDGTASKDLAEFIQKL